MQQEVSLRPGSRVRVSFPVSRAFTFISIFSKLPLFPTFFLSLSFYGWGGDSDFVGSDLRAFRESKTQLRRLHTEEFGSVGCPIRLYLIHLMDTSINPDLRQHISLPVLDRDGRLWTAAGKCVSNPNNAPVSQTRENTRHCLALCKCPQRNWTRDLENSYGTLQWLWVRYGMALSSFSSKGDIHKLVQ